MPEKPRILDRKSLVNTRVFHIEQLDLEFSNGETRSFERIVGGKHGAVLVVPLLDPGTLLLIREFSAGSERYELTFPKGGIEKGETPVQAAHREMREEIGYGSNNIELLRNVALAPAYMQHHTHLMLARDWVESRLKGDEPEPIETVPWELDRVDELLAREDFNEARSILALMLTMRKFRKGAGPVADRDAGRTAPVLHLYAGATNDNT